MPPPTNLKFIDKTILNFIIGTYFGIKNPLPTLVCLPGLIAGNPKVYLQLVGTYGAVLGAITSLVALGYTIRYATRIVKKIIQKKKHRPLKPVENKFIARVAKDSKHTKKVTKKNLRKFLPKLTPKQNKAITNKIKKIKKFKKFKKMKFGEETLFQAVNSTVNNRVVGKTLTTGIAGGLANAAGGAGAEGMQEVYHLKKYLLKERIEPIEERIKNLEGKQKFGGITSSIYYGATGTITTTGCFIKLNSFKSKLLSRLIKIDFRISILEGSTPKINKDIYNKVYKLGTLGKAGSFLHSGGGGLCRSNILQTKRQIIEILDDFVKRITKLEEKKSELEKKKIESEIKIVESEIKKAAFGRNHY
jgi:hypothetical protein